MVRPLLGLTIVIVMHVLLTICKLGISTFLLYLDYLFLDYYALAIPVI